MPILSRFRRNRHHAQPQTQPRLAAQTTPAADTLIAADWIDIQLLAHKTIPLQSFANATRLANGLWHWRFFSDTEADRRIMARLQSRHLIEPADAAHTCARLTTHGVTQVFHLCRHIRLAETAMIEHANVATDISG